MKGRTKGVNGRLVIFTLSIFEPVLTMIFQRFIFLSKLARPLEVNPRISVVNLHMAEGRRSFEKTCGVISDLYYNDDFELYTHKHIIYT